MKTIDIETMLQYAYPNRVCYNPSGKLAAFVLSRPDEATNDYENTLWIYENGTLKPAFPIGKMCSYIWDDDESVLFLGQLSEDHSTIYRGSVHAGRVEKVAEFPLNIKEFAKMDCGLLLANCRTDANYPDMWSLSPEERAAKQQERELESENYQVLDEIPFCKNGIHEWINKQRNTLFILDLHNSGCTRITDRWFQTERWCIDGDTVFFNGSAYEKKLCVFQEIWSYRIGDEAPRRIYGERKYNMRGLGVWDGKLVMFGNTNPNVKLFHSEFYLVDKKSGEITSFCAYDRSIRSYVTGDGAYGEPRLYQTSGGRLYFISSIDNEAWLMSIDADGEVRPVIRHEGAFCDFDIHGGSIFFTALWDNKPLECYEAELSNPERTVRQVSSFNAGPLADRYVASPQPYSFQFDGWRIDGWALLPKDYDPGRSYPAVLDIHGGPNAVFSTAFNHEMQVLASRGFFVLFCNPVGSEGRGDNFMNIHGRFGDRDYACLMEFVDGMLEKYPQIDRSRLCVTGGSYGGFMTNWIIAHTDRFAAAATQRSIANQITLLLLCDNGWYNMPLQMQANAYTGAEKLWEQSPLKYIDQVKTPTLVLHSEQDYSVPIEEGMQIYSALVAKGVDTRMVRFRNENHELSRSGRPLHRVRRLQEIVQWLESHI